ncbi:MAG: DUF302 domain-containing protein [Deltaproteobacteria bacterium]|nr:DUF302 domain-containing protein [Deltaproteobacteria bacterium]MBN2672491.1 DUF302 domain-containing protein [Deltaproteobacteria bacterium]
MKYIVETNKPFKEALGALLEEIPKHQFGVLHTHDINATLNSKGVPFEKQVSVLEVCNPKKANAVLSEDMSLNMVLPCRISVWEDDGAVKMGTIRPTALISELNDSKALKIAAKEVEDTLIAIIEAAV